MRYRWGRSAGSCHGEFGLSMIRRHLLALVGASGKGRLGHVR